jgi:cytochrome c553
MFNSRFLLIGFLALLQWQGAAAQTPAPPSPLTQRLAEAQKDPALASSMQKLGKKAIGSVCVNCHGETGNSVQPDVPNLAGQNRAYLLEQMRLFAEGKRRHNFMEGIMKALSADEKVGLVLLFSSQEVVAKPAANTALADKGAVYYKKVCIACHGDSGRGNEQIARISGQQPAYLRTSLNHYRDGDGVRNNPLMVNVAKTMSHEDIDAVTAFLSSMK